MEKKFDVVALGELLIDFTLNGLSEQGNQMFEANPGGAPCNVLALLNKMGKETAFIGKVGEDQFGKLLRQTLVEVGIETEGLVMDQNYNTTLALVHTFPNGDRDFSFYRKPGADMMLTEDEVSKELIQSARVFHYGTLSMTDEGVECATKKAIDAAKEAGLLLSFDPNLRPPLWDSLERAKEKIQYGLSNCDILKISEEELEFMTGTKDIDEGVKILREQYPDIKLFNVTAGANGSYSYYKNMVAFRPSFLLGGTIETTGAGDTFCGSVIYYVLENGMENLSKEQLEEMLTFANAAAYTVTTKKGAIHSMPTREEVEKIIARVQ